ncbi:MAG: hypothetical protein JWQ94_1604, partial [Tardiphaga sp.]|nr:hypothetical protein [Tardiphaga sp.]
PVLNLCGYLLTYWGWGIAMPSLERCRQAVVLRRGGTVSFARCAGTCSGTGQMAREDLSRLLNFLRVLPDLSPETAVARMPPSADALLIERTQF